MGFICCIVLYRSLSVHILHHVSRLMNSHVDSADPSGNDGDRQNECGTAGSAHTRVWKSSLDTLFEGIQEGALRKVEIFEKVD